VTAAQGRLLDPVVRAGSTENGPFALSISPAEAGWQYSGLKILELQPGQRVEFDTADTEVIVLPLSGSCEVACEGTIMRLAGRPSVFEAITDFGYLPRDARVSVTSAGGGRFALPSAKAGRRLEPRYQPASAVAVELRGAGSASRQVNNFCAPEEFDADRLIAVEVLTPGGNWSSYPPHKHDRSTEVESQLEEIYYFEVASEGPAYQRVYSSAEDRQIDVTAEVRSGDVVLIPHGYHGPSMAAPGYDLYYLNVMAGPGERVWRFCDDPTHAWIRESWQDQQIDPRLPLTSVKD